MMVQVVPNLPPMEFATMADPVQQTLDAHLGKIAPIVCACHECFEWLLSSFAAGDLTLFRSKYLAGGPSDGLTITDMRVNAVGEYNDCPSVLPVQNFTFRGALLNAVDTWCADPTAGASTYGPIEDWDVSRVKDFSHLFCAKPNDVSCNPDCANFNANIGSWNVSQATSLEVRMLHRSLARILGCTFARVPDHRRRSTPIATS